MSRLLNDNTEWKLDSQIFHKILKLFSVKPETEIFASHLNYQIPTDVSWNPDKNAYAIDAFSMSWANLKFYAFPPFSLIGTSISKIRREMAVGITIIPWWVTQFWFPMMVPLLQDFPVVLPPNVLTLPSDKGLQHPLYTKTAGSSFIGEAFRYTELPSKVTKVILELWRPSTRSRYESVLKRWHRYAISRNEDPYSPDVNTVLTFMHGMYLNGCFYSGLCAARSALSSVVTIRGYLKLSEHLLVSRYLKGIYNRHPPLPKYVNIWDISLLLRYYDNMDSNDNLQFKVLVKKTVMLFIILGARRKQALFTLSTDSIIFKENKVILLPNITMKHTKPNTPLEPLIYHHYPENQKLCIVNCLKSYTGMRNALVREEIKDLIISFRKPHKPVSHETISRWIKNELTDTGVDTSVFKAHSCRSASSSKAKDIDVSLNEILKRGRWKSKHTCRTYYSRDIINEDNRDFEFDYVTPILSKS